MISLKNSALKTIKFRQSPGKVCLRLGPRVPDPRLAHEVEAALVDNPGPLSLGVRTEVDGRTGELGPSVIGGFRWTAAGGMERIGGVSTAAISRDGKTIVGSVRDQALREMAAI